MGYYKSSTEVKETVRTATVEYGHLSDSISATGSLSAVDNVDISSKITAVSLKSVLKRTIMSMPDRYWYV